MLSNRRYWQRIVALCIVLVLFSGSLVVYMFYPSGKGQIAIPKTFEMQRVPVKSPQITPMPCDRYRTSYKTVSSVAEVFIRSAVVRENLERSYWLVTKDIRQSQTCKEWMMGSIAVIPFFNLEASRICRVNSFINARQISCAKKLAPSQSAKRAMFFVRLASSKTDYAFWLGLVKKRDSRWLVNYWSPVANFSVPSGA